MRASLPPLPHAFPFRLVTQRDGAALVLVSAGDARGRGHAYPAALAIEILAQAAALTLKVEGGGPSPGGGGRLVGIDEARLERPLVPGERLLATTAQVGRFGPLIKVEGRLEREDGETVAKAGLLLALG